MNGKEYEVVKEYEISGIRVTSDVVKDAVTQEPRMRSVFIRSSCESRRWGTRTQDHSYSCAVNLMEFAKNFEQARFRAAETLIKTERGEISETGVELLQRVSKLGSASHQVLMCEAG